MTTQGLRFPASLLTRLVGVLALAASMAVLSAVMGTTLQKRTADLATASIRKPTWHVFHHLLATQTILLGQEWALGTSFLVQVAVMCSLRVTARLGTGTGEWARGWFGTTRLRWVED